jgi:hypothetical protein
MWSCVVFAALAALSSVAITPRTSRNSADPTATDTLVVA